MSRPQVAREAFAVAAGVAAASCAIGLSAVAAWLIATAAQHPRISTLAVAIVAVRAFGVGRGVLRYAERLIGHDAVLRKLADTRAVVVAKLAVLAPAGLPELRSGDLTSRLVNDVDSTADRALRLRLPALIAAFVAFGTTLGAAFVFPPAAIALLAGLAVLALGGPAIARRVAGRSREFVAPRRGEYAAAVTQTMHGAADLIAFDAVDAALAALDERDRSVTRAANSTAWRQGLAAAVAVAAGGGVPLAAIWLGVPAVKDGALAPALLAVVVLAPLAIYETFAALPLAAAQIPDFKAAEARLADIESRPAPVREPVGVGVSTDVELPGPYDVEVRDLAVRWPAIDAGPTPPPALSGVSFRVAPGERVAVVGPSGCGKSTLAAALVRFLDPVEGSIRIAGVDVRTLPSDTIRTVVGLCAQDAYVFDSSIAENVRLARPDASDGEVMRALDRAGLGAWVRTLPDGPQTRVGEHGGSLSGGQRQRLSLARALLADKPIVILDEPTEHVDEETAVALIRDLLDSTSGRTVLLMTHRQQDLAFVDSVVQLSPSSVPATDH